MRKLSLPAHKRACFIVRQLFDLCITRYWLLLYLLVSLLLIVVFSVFTVITIIASIMPLYLTIATISCRGLRKQISSATTLLRHLWWDACNSKTDAYFISLDFRKVFDSLDQRWLFRVLQKMNFLVQFIRIIQSLNNNANVKFLVNGFQTQNISIQKGVRQVDPLSLYLFLLAVEPLVTTINNNQNIEGLGKERRRNIKCPSYANDLTLTLFGSRLVVLAFEIIQNFSEATGLKLNIQKTQGMAVDSSCINNLLPSINWQNDSIKILGLKIGRLN